MTHQSTLTRRKLKFEALVTHPHYSKYFRKISKGEREQMESFLEMAGDLHPGDFVNLWRRTAERIKARGMAGESAGEQEEIMLIVAKEVKPNDE